MIMLGIYNLFVSISQVNILVNMSKQFSGKVVLITGAESGIGAGTALYFSSLGASLALNGLNLENLKKVCEKCTTKHTKPFLIPGDITKSEDQHIIINSLIEHFGKLDVLVNNADILEVGCLQQITVDQLEKIHNTNVQGLFQITKLAIPYLIKTKGNIVNVSSHTSLGVYPEYVSYSMSKSAVDKFTECLAIELASEGVRVNSVNPGIIHNTILTKMGLTKEKIDQLLEDNKKKHPLGRNGTVEDVAKAIAFLASDKASFITGVHLPIDGGRHAVCSR